MTKKELLKLLLNETIFNHVVVTLGAMGYIEMPSENPDISRLVLTDKGKELITTKTASVSPAFVHRYRDLFPPYRKGDLGSVSNNLAWLIVTHNFTEDQIISATNAYINTVDDPKYCQQADYFIYKNMPGGTVRNSILGFLVAVDSTSLEEGYGWEIV